MKKRLKKDIIIPAGTILSRASTKTVRHGQDHFSCSIGLSPDSSGSFEYCIDDPDLSEFFEDADD